MDILQNIYNTLLLEKQEKERVLESIINKPTNYQSQLKDSLSILKEISMVNMSLAQFESYLKQSPPQNPQGTVSQPQAPQAVTETQGGLTSEEGLGVVAPI